jgi:hypothetical protein
VVDQEIYTLEMKQSHAWAHAIPMKRAYSQERRPAGSSQSLVAKAQPQPIVGYGQSEVWSPAM